MILAIVSSIPTPHHQLAPEQIQLADKKIAGVALDALERTRHLDLLQVSSDYKTFYDSKSARVHWINDVYTRVFDTTAEGVVSIVDEGIYEKLYITGHELVMTMPDKFLSMIFSRLAGTDYLVVSDGNAKDQYVVKQEILPSEVLEFGLCWDVNTRLCSQEYTPAVEEVHGWASFEVAPAKEVTKFVGRFTPQFIPNSVTESMVATLPENDADLPRLKHQINRMLSSPTPALRALHERSFAANLLYQTVFNAKLARIHSFTDTSVKLFDYTQAAIAATHYSANTKMEYIFLEKKIVDYPSIFSSSPQSMYTQFSREFPGFTDKVIVRDVPNLKNWVKIERWRVHADTPEPLIHYVHLFPDAEWHVPQGHLPAITTITDRPIRVKSASGKKAQAI